jgi:tryptophanyl-tRNA synthetase
MPSRVLTGDRPTGALHLGHYFGTLANRVRLQSQGHDVFVVVADYQVLTDRDHPGDLTSTVVDMVIDYIACGLDQERTTVFPHSAVPALNQLFLPFLSVVSAGELSRNPTVKEEMRLAERSQMSGLMLTYPVHQAADILFCKADLVPVGRDQLPHLEMTRTIARRLNERYGPLFPLPSPLLSDAPLLLGLDGRKMSKSLHNAIALRDMTHDVVAKIRAARTDCDRHIAFDPTNRPAVSNLLRLAALCLGRDEHLIAEDVGDAGAAALKDVVITAIEALLAPIRERRANLRRHDAEAVLRRGTEIANDIADATLREVREAMGMTYGTALAVKTALADQPCELVSTP